MRFLWLALAVMLSSVAFAQAQAPQPLVHATLIAPQTAAVPGQTLTLGVQLRVEPSWHVYWLNPGDSGMATRVLWQLPDSVTASPLRWPMPTRFVQGDLVSFGYESQVVLLTDVQVPADFSADTLTLKGTVKWLACKEACVAGQSAIELTLPVAAQAQPVPEHQSTIESTTRQLPVAAPPGVRVWWDGSDRILLAVPINTADAEAARGVYFHPANPGVIELASPQPARIESADSSARLIVQLTPSPIAGSDVPRLVGVLAWGVAADSKPLAIDVVIEPAPSASAGAQVQ